MISIQSLFFICISIFIAHLDGRKDNPLLIYEAFITLVLLISSYLSSLILIHFEAEKNHLIFSAYRKQVQLEERLKYDSLTNLYNTKTFYHILEVTIKDNEMPLSIAVIDIDDFKSVNDTWGHEQGNQVLIYLAELLRSYCSPHGYVFRYGGEEFTVIFPNLSSSHL